MRRELNLRQQRFVDAYLIDPNATQAAITAGYAPKFAGPDAGKLLRNPKIAAAIERVRNRETKRKIATADDVAEIMTDLLTDTEQPGVVRVSAAARLADQRGYNAPKKLQIDERGVHLHIHREPKPE